MLCGFIFIRPILLLLFEYFIPAWQQQATHIDQFKSLKCLDFYNCVMIYTHFGGQILFYINVPKTNLSRTL